MNHTCRAANFRALLRQDDIQDAVAEIIGIYDKLQLEDGRGTRIVDILRLSDNASFPDLGDPGNATIKVIRTKEKMGLDDVVFQSFLALLND